MIGVLGSLPPADAAITLRMLALLAFGTWAARPVALVLVPGGGGWIAALMLAWAVIGWVPWAVSALGLLPLDQAGLAGLLFLLAVRQCSPSAPPDLRGAAALALGFAGLFWLGLAQRLGRADLTGLEKFTDMGFLSAVMRADWMPPPDAWYAGGTINYYYVGQAMAGVWGTLAAAPPDAAYQLAMATLFALTGLGVFRLTYGLAAGHGARIAAVLAGSAVPLALFGGNLHSALYTIWRDWMPTTKESFYFPDSTRFIGFDPPTLDKGFTEFTAYGFAVGDLHAHVVATPIFLLGLMIVLSILSRGMQGRLPGLGPSIGLGWVLGLCVAVNSWDVAILGMIALIVALILGLRPSGPLLPKLDHLGAASVAVLGTAFLTAAPFLATFTPFANGVELAPARSPLWQLLVLYGHVLPAGALLVVLGLRHSAGACGLATALLLASALLLIALPETLIIKDIYGEDFARANTMFKLTFRAQSLLVIAGLAALAPAVALGGRWLALALLAAVPLMMPLVYAPHIYSPPSAIRSLDGLAFLKDERALVTAVGQISVAPGSVLIEASGDAFGETGRVSAMTGQQAVVGWAGHQWLWRGDGDTPNRRAADVRRFYTTTDAEERCRIVRRYSISLVILGQVEARQYPDLRAHEIAALGPTIHDSAGGRIIQVRPEACR